MAVMVMIISFAAQTHLQSTICHRRKIVGNKSEKELLTAPRPPYTTLHGMNSIGYFQITINVHVLLLYSILLCYYLFQYDHNLVIADLFEQDGIAILRQT